MANASAQRTPLLIAVSCATAFLVLLILVWIKWTPLIHADRAAESRLDKMVGAHPRVADIALAVSSVGRPLVFEVVLLVVAAVELARRRVRIVATLILALLLELGLGQLVKTSVDRRRPTVSEQLAYQAGPSFPSAHALASATIVCSFLLVVAPCYLAPRAQHAAWAAGATIVFLVGLSRLLLAVHYPSDVVGGWLLGVTIAVGVAEAVYRLPRALGALCSFKRSSDGG